MRRAREMWKRSISRASSLFWALTEPLRRRYGRLRGTDVRSIADLYRFWCERKGKPGPPVSSSEGNAALIRTMNINTREVCYDLNVDNYRRNTESLKAGRGICEMERAHSGETVFLVGAGPSLDCNVHELRAVQGKHAIFACDAALPMLIAAGIEPDYVVVIDTKATQARFFACLEGRKPRTKLLAIACAHPDVIEAWPGEILFFNSWGDKEDHDLQLKYGKDFGSLGVGGNVSTAILWLAAAFCEASTIVFVGHDFSFTSSYYASSGVHELASPKRARYWWDIHGETVATNFSLWAYRLFTEEYIADLLALDKRVKEYGHPGYNFRFINATEGGILGTTETYGVNSGVFTYRSLQDVIAELTNPMATVGARVSAVPIGANETGVAARVGAPGA